MKNKDFSVFETWELAFDRCRELDKPLLVRVSGVKGKIFPSGHCEHLTTGFKE